jgi:protein import protein ZIM17
MEPSRSVFCRLGLNSLRIIQPLKPRRRCLQHTNHLRGQFPLRVPSHSNFPYATLRNNSTAAPPTITYQTTPESTSRQPRPLTSASSHPSDPSPADASAQRSVPAYELTISCRPCHHRSAHRISHQGYHHGTVIVTCPKCKNRHVISDHLKIFSDKRVTLEDILKDKGELLKKGRLDAGADGDMEFWDDGTETRRVEPKEGEERRY